MKSLGICIGATTLSTVGLSIDTDNSISTTDIFTEPHNGNPQETLLKALAELNINNYSRIAVTGRKFRNFVNLSSISEPEAVEVALFHLNGKQKRFNAIVSIGGETFMVYALGKDGRITSVQTGNKCASGTGEFFLQQIRRMGITLDEAINIAQTEEPYTVAGRCSVFCKSDCTHATNKGVPKGRVAAGLCQMMAGKVLEIIKQIPRKDIMVIGGTSQNSVMIDYLEREITNLVVPKEAPYFEALGCALWALNNETIPFPETENLFKSEQDPFFYLPTLKNFENRVDFKTTQRGEVREGDRCILGLDVGSTTTKAIILRISDNKVLASIYLRTSGDPVSASMECYEDLYNQLGTLEDKIKITGLGVTGSGRQIAGLHAMTDCIINEIIAHAAGALFFDPEVDTIFEIGGQDAKYTYITNGVASDYAMNEACSAGTGSFLEEAAKETLGIEMEEIADIALRGQKPPNFNDQCAAFISSDIKNALHEGLKREDIVAGLVYSVCMNYDNRVKGNRPVGNKVFMQGGVCYNRAVPIAMASLTGKRIIVPPDPGLTGAFGVALEVKRRLETGLTKEKAFSLKQLKDRTLKYGKPFICKGGKEKCDRKCEIARIEIENEIHPFGGACNRWYNLRFNINVNPEELDLVALYEKLIFHKYINSSEEPDTDKDSKTIGINKSFWTNTYYPLLHDFFSRIGFKVQLSDTIDKDGMDRKGTAFCYPAEISHGYLGNILKKMPDYLFLPQVKGNYVENGLNDCSSTCPLSQGEPYYLASAFKDHEIYRELKKNDGILSPVIDFSQGYRQAEDTFVSVTKKLGVGKNKARLAYKKALSVQETVFDEMKEKGREVLTELEANPDMIAIVVFGRSYNAFVSEAHMGIPNKFASRGVKVIPFEFLPLKDEPVDNQMFWSAGQSILKGASYVKKHPQLFGCYITNFSCGPDSFLIGYFRDLMGKKPSLTLELDSHVADAGLETRIEAFMDIIKSYRELDMEIRVVDVSDNFVPARVHSNHNQQVFTDSSGKECSIFDPYVHLIFPSMGKFHTEAAAAAFRGMGIRASALPPADEEALRLGKGNTTCKECLPLLLTTGSLLKYLKHRENDKELVIYFMTTASGPCRFGQYSVFINNLIAKLKIENVALFSLTAENSYADIDEKHLTSRLWASIVISDIMEEIYSLVLTNAVNPNSAMHIYREECRRITRTLESYSDLKELTQTLETVASNLKKIPMKRFIEDTPVVLLTGEIFVRNDDISRQFIVERLARKGFATKVSSVSEWIYYTDWCFKNNLSRAHFGLKEKLSLLVRSRTMKKYEKTFKKILAKSDLFQYKLEDIDHLVSRTRHLINPELTGEAILTTGASINEVLDHYCGVIAIGPFGCMPNRISEAILSREMNRDGKTATGTSSKRTRNLLNKIEDFPFLAIESDGNPFPQIITAKLETFLLQAGRVHEEMQKSFHAL
ncbi:MAG: acyl-CoA dehydratase activase [Syntrophales bacterium]|nr:acyl-CoA dehydratase activase [Syntrophales bacterium]